MVECGDKIMMKMILYYSVFLSSVGLADEKEFNFEDKLINFWQFLITVEKQKKSSELLDSIKKDIFIFKSIRSSAFNDFVVQDSQLYYILPWLYKSKGKEIYFQIYEKALEKKNVNLIVAMMLNLQTPKSDEDKEKQYLSKKIVEGYAHLKRCEAQDFLLYDYYKFHTTGETIQRAGFKGDKEGCFKLVDYYKSIIVKEKQERTDEEEKIVVMYEMLELFE